MSDIQKYLKDVKKYSNVISVDKEVEYFRLLNDPLTSEQQKNIIKEQITKANLRFVITIAKRYVGATSSIELGDLINEGNIGLIRAIDTFDVTKGFKFITHAVWYIKREINNTLTNDSRTIRIPSNVIIESTKNQEVADSLPTTVNLQSQLNDNSCLIDVLIDNQSIDPLNELISNNEEVSSKINGILHGLDKREQLIIRKYFGLGCEAETLDKIGEELKCSKERVRQLKDVALKKIRNDSYSLLKFLS